MVWCIGSVPGLTQVPYYRWACLGLSATMAGANLAVATSAAAAGAASAQVPPASAVGATKAAAPAAVGSLACKLFGAPPWRSATSSTKSYAAWKAAKSRFGGATTAPCPSAVSGQCLGVALTQVGLAGRPGTPTDDELMAAQIAPTKEDPNDCLDFCGQAASQESECDWSPTGLTDESQSPP